MLVDEPAVAACVRVRVRVRSRVRVVLVRGEVDVLVIVDVVVAVTVSVVVDPVPHALSARHTGSAKSAASRHDLAWTDPTRR